MHDHPHDHTHDHTHHHHEHDHAHAHSHDVASTLSFEEKLIKLLEHWIKHNEDHTNTYADWAERAKTEGLGDVGTILAEAVEITRSVSSKFEAALAQLKKS